MNDRRISRLIRLIPPAAVADGFILGFATATGLGLLYLALI